MDTCQGHECALAGSPFTMRVRMVGGMAGIPHGLGHSEKLEENHYNPLLGCMCMYQFVCVLFVYENKA